MTNIIRIVAIFFALAFSYLLLSFSTGVGENINFFHLMLFLFFGILSQLGLFLSSFSIKNWIINILIAVIMLPFFALLVKSTFLDSSFLNRLTGAPIQITSSLAYIVGLIVYIYSYYRLLWLQNTRQL